MSGLPSSASDRDSALVDALLKLNAAQGQQHRQQQQHQQNLQIPSNTAGSHHPQSGIPSQNDATSMNSSLYGGNNPRTMPIPGLSSSFSSALGIHPSLLGLLQPCIESSQQQQQTNFFASQLAAASAPLLPASPVTSLSQQIQAMQQAASARLSSNNNNSSNVGLPAAPTSATETAASANKQASATSPPIASKPSSSPSPESKEETGSRSSSTVTVPTTTVAVRPEKVEAALRSKPQRGKRREDLSETERMELTRTRNREHAKSTRLRKKARYQELLDSEEQLNHYRQVETLRQERMTSIQKFLLVREAMLNDVVKEEAAAASSSSTISVPPGLLELVEHLGTFQLEVHGQKSMASNVSSASLQQQSDHRQLALLRMKRWDGDIRGRFQSILYSKKEEEDDAKPNPPSSSFHYKLLDGPNGVAISENGTGFARVDLEIQQGKQDPPTDGSQSKLVLTGILTVQFASTSSRLSSASWTTTQFAPSFSVDSGRSNVAGAAAAEGAASPRDDPSSSSNDSLENQMIHPSVVSLEIKASHTTDTAESPGPGMTI